MSRLGHTNAVKVILCLVTALLVAVVTMVSLLGVAGADDEPPETTTTTPTVAPTTTTAAAPTTTEMTPPPTHQPTVPPTRQTTTTVRVTTTTLPVSTTIESTTSSTRRTTTTENPGTTIQPAIISPSSSDSVDRGPGGGSGGGMSTGLKLALIVGGLGAVGAAIAALTLAYWRHTRPLRYLDAMDVLRESSPAGGGGAPGWTAVVKGLKPVNGAPEGAASSANEWFSDGMVRPPRSSGPAPVRVSADELDLTKLILGDDAKPKSGGSTASDRNPNAGEPEESVVEPVGSVDKGRIDPPSSLESYENADFEIVTLEDLAGETRGIDPDHAAHSGQIPEIEPGKTGGASGKAAPPRLKLWDPDDDRSSPSKGSGSKDEVRGPAEMGRERPQDGAT